MIIYITLLQSLCYINLEASESADHMTRNRYSVSAAKILIGASLILTSRYY